MWSRPVTTLPAILLFSPPPPPPPLATRYGAEHLFYIRISAALTALAALCVSISIRDTETWPFIPAVISFRRDSASFVAAAHVSPTQQEKERLSPFLHGF